MRIMILGASGQDGSFLVDHYLEQGDEVLAVSRNFNSESGSFPSNLRRIALDLTDTQSFRELLRSSSPDIVIHAAAIHGSSENMNIVEVTFQEQMHLCHVEVTREILHWQINNPNSKSLILLSAHMYSPQEETLVVSADTPFAPQNVYGQTKMNAFELIRFMRDEYQLSTVGLILFNHTSRRAGESFLFSKIAQQLAVQWTSDNVIHLELNDPEALLDIVSAEEVATLITRIAEGNCNRDYVIGRGELISLETVIEKSFALLPGNRTYKIDRKSEVIKIRKSYVADISAIQQDFGWNPILEAHEILHQMITHRIGNDEKLSR